MSGPKPKCTNTARINTKSSPLIPASTKKRTHVPEKLSLINFKNIREENLEFRPGINCFVGDNGAGKTNVIDAVYFLSMCKSSLAMTDGQNMRHGSDFFLLDGQYLTDEGRSESVVCAFARKGGKTLKRNGKEYERLSDHVGLIPVVIVSPADTMLISDAADERRRYLNGFISQLDRAYLQALVRYNAVLGERNRLLKISRDEQMLCIYDRQLVEQGGIIHRKRSEIAALLEPEVARYYRHLSSDREQVTLEYRSELNDTPFEELLLKSRERISSTDSPLRASTATTWYSTSAAIPCANTVRRDSKNRF